MRHREARLAARRSDTPRMELTACPDCGLPAEIVDRQVWPSTDGPIPMAHVLCVRRHTFFLPADHLQVDDERPGRSFARSPRP